MIALLTFGKKDNKKKILFTENDVRDEIFRRSLVNSEAGKQAILASIAPVLKQETKVVKTAPVKANPHAATIQKLDEILNKVSGFENSKIAVIAELALALETGNDKDLIKLLKSKDKVVAKKAKKKTWEL
jgi:hypothetical protein